MKLFRILGIDYSEGDSEEDVANRLLNIYIELGASNHSFNPIVAFGKNGTDPHHENDNTLLTKGDSIIIDMGCVYERLLFQGCDKNIFL